MRLRNMLAVTLAGATVTLFGAAGAGAQTDPGTVNVGPNQYFAGLVNGNMPSATLSVQGCGNGGTDGQLIAGQTVSARYFPVPPPVAYGTHFLAYTGNASSLTVDLLETPTGPSAGASPIVLVRNVGTLTAYGTQLFFGPGFSVPCNDSITALFTPTNGGPNAVASQISVSLVTPTIALSQTSAKPGKTIDVTGTAFVPNSTLSIEECSQTSWIVPQNKCVASNAVTVQADATGAFSTPFKVEMCASPAAAATETCYIGAPQPEGVDVITLVGAAAIKVN